MRHVLGLLNSLQRVHEYRRNIVLCIGLPEACIAELLTRGESERTTPKRTPKNHANGITAMKVGGPHSMRTIRLRAEAIIAVQVVGGKEGGKRRSGHTRKNENFRTTWVG